LAGNRALPQLIEPHGAAETKLRAPRQISIWEVAMGRFTIVCAVMALVPGTVLAEEARRAPNTVRYRVTAPAVSGPAGNATVYTRALIAKDGVGTVEIATAPFGTVATAPITFVQVRALRPSGGVAFARNFTDTRIGTLLWPFADLAAGQKLQLDVHVDDNTVPRTDVAMLEDVVRLRPDLRVTAVKVPPRILTGVPAIITATVNENNGETGARATCMLIVDNVPVDYIQNMWVDRGDSVSCAFTYAFGSEGSHAVRVAVTNVEPWDWDDANNTFERTVEVVAPFRTFDSYYVGAGESTETQSGYHKVSYTYAGSPVTGEDYLREGRFTSWSQGIDVNAHVTHRWSFPIASIDVVASDETGTRLASHITDLAETSSSNYPNYQWSCGSRGDGSARRSTYAYACSVHNELGDWSSLLFLQHDGAVTYASLEYDRTWSGNPDNVTGYKYYWNDNHTEGSGDLVPYGSNLLVTATVSSAGFYDGIEATLTMGAWTTTRWDEPVRCGVDTYSWGTASYCTDFHDVKTSRYSVITGGIWP
jgi:hypothetical protein